MSDITIGRLRGGYCVRWIDPDTGKRRRYQLAARTRTEAEGEARDRYPKETALTRDMSVRDIRDHYIKWLGDKPTAETMRYTGKAVLAHFGDLYPRHITDADCAAYVSARVTGGRTIGTVHTELGHLRSAVSWAAKKRLIDFAPQIPRPPKPDSDVTPLSDAEAVRLIDSCDVPHVRLAVVLA
ncbi:hypothetical protein SAMN05444004_109124 [Jannaschia faecimaris]|uniref:Core-binding (CB) domain-containing protein n=1 Tax=Jannaschia faecimaris TaxID=1244108 RepID=A0A1H3RUG6_9RHOB|nr:hypothetical protein [Jannaschia faecimaris]SDZ28911.1 hypothetical protein SAMN05444004_109124 [Jannaschia faecimaris]